MNRIWWNSDTTEWTITRVTETKWCHLQYCSKKKETNIMQTIKMVAMQNMLQKFVNRDKKELCRMEKGVSPNGHRALRLEPRNTSTTALSGALYYTKACLHLAEKISFYIPSGCQKVSEASVLAHNLGRVESGCPVCYRRWGRVCLRQLHPLWMYFLITTQPCLKSGQGRLCCSVHMLAQGSKASMVPSAGPSLLTMPPVA